MINIEKGVKMRLRNLYLIIKEPQIILYYLEKMGLYRMSDKDYLKILFKLMTQKELNLNNPKSFNEKLQWLKLNDRKKEYTQMVDKYEVKKYVSDKIGEEYIIPTLGIYNSWSDIDINNLPKQFVIKCTHDSGGIVICKDKNKFDFDKAREKINKNLNKNFYYSGREWPYKNVKPRIIIEKYMEDTETKELRDYKFFCFNGKVKFFKVDFDRFKQHKANYFDITGNILPFGEVICPPDFNKEIKMPDNLNKMIELAEKIAKDTIFVRVDFYNVNEKIYFGEITFFPASGFGKFVPDEWDKKIGDMLILPLKESNEK